MPAHICRVLAVFGACFGAVSGPASAQDFNVSDIFSNQRFYEEHGLLQAIGDMHFIADVWYLPGPADSTRAFSVERRPPG